MSRMKMRGNAYRRVAGDLEPIAITVGVDSSIRGGAPRRLAVAGMAAALALAAAQPAAAQSTNPPCPGGPTAPAAAGTYDSTLPQKPGNVAPTTGTIEVKSTDPDDPTVTVGGSASIELLAATDSDGSIAYYCGRNDVEANAPLLRRPNPFPHVFQTPGRITVDRFAVDNNGFKSATQTVEVPVNAPPRATFDSSTTTPAVGETVTFTARATDTDGTIAKEEFDFDDDRVFETPVPPTRLVTFRWDSAGIRIVRFQATDSSGSKRRGSVSINVGNVQPAPPPAAPAAAGGAGAAPPAGAGVAATANPSAQGARPSQVSSRPCSNVVRGTARKDTLTGGSGGDRILGLGGSDILNGASGDDCLFGGVGDDKLTGGSGRDTLVGGPGKDRLTGGPGDDRLTGAAGADILAGGAGTNRYSAGGGDDSVNSVNGKRETVSCGGGRDVARVDAVDRVRGCERVIRAG